MRVLGRGDCQVCNQECGQVIEFTTRGHYNCGGRVHICVHCLGDIVEDAQKTLVFKEVEEPSSCTRCGVPFAGASFMVGQENLCQPCMLKVFPVVRTQGVT